MADQVCLVCHGTEFSTNASGHLVCVECGTQIVLMSQIEEHNDELTDIARDHGRLKVLRVRKEGAEAGAERRAIKTRTSSGRLLRVVLRVHQAVLKLQIQALCDKFGVPRALDRAMKQIWFAFLQLWNDAGVPVIRVYGKTISTSVSQHYMMNWPSDLPPPPLHVPPLSSWITLSFLSLACRWLACGVTPVDVTRWANNGDIPFLNMVSLLPQSDFDGLLPMEAKLLTRYFMHSAPPSPFQVRNRMVWIAKALGVPLVQANPIPAALRWTQLLQLPAGTWSSALRILALVGQHNPDYEAQGLLHAVTAADKVALVVLATLCMAAHLTPQYDTWVRAVLAPHAQESAALLVSPTTAGRCVGIVPSLNEFWAPHTVVDALRMAPDSVHRYIDFIRRCFPVPPYLSLHEDCRLLADSLARTLQSSEDWLAPQLVPAFSPPGTAPAPRRRRSRSSISAEDVSDTARRASRASILTNMAAAWTRYRWHVRSSDTTAVRLSRALDDSFITFLADFGGVKRQHLLLTLEYVENIVKSACVKGSNVSSQRLNRQAKRRAVGGHAVKV